jgi:hypothetical protein
MAIPPSPNHRSMFFGCSVIPATIAQGLDVWSTPRLHSVGRAMQRKGEQCQLR